MRSLPALLLLACAPPLAIPGGSSFVTVGRHHERVRVLDLHPGVTATIVAPQRLDLRERVELILYALPNGNSTAETMGRRAGEGIGWRHDIQHIAAQTRALRARGLSQAVVVYLEADTKSWPAWRSRLGYDRANARIVDIVDQVRAALRQPPSLAVTLTGHSGGGSFAWGFIDGRTPLPDWLERIAFLDANYSFEPRHGERIVDWLRRDPAHTLVVLAYDDREVTLDGRKVMSDSGGTWRASHRMLESLRRSFVLSMDTVGAFLRYRHPQIEVLLHPNPERRILHTALIGEMNGYMHALLVRRPSYTKDAIVLRAARAYLPWVDDGITLPPARPTEIPPRAAGAPTGSAFIRSVESLDRDAREAAVRRELLSGNVPAFLRRFRRVQLSAAGADSARRTIAYEVMPDYLAIGHDTDFVRMPMTPYTAQAFADAFGFVLPTRRMADDIWRAAPVHLEPRPLTQERESPRTFLQHHRIIEGQLADAGAERGAFIAGHKKDVVVTNRLQERADRVAIYGWHYPSGRPIQPLYVGHVDWYVDYSHGIRPVRRAMRVDGVPRSFEEIVGDSALAALLSDEGPIAVPRYDWRPPRATDRDSLAVEVAAARHLITRYAGRRVHLDSMYAVPGAAPAARTSRVRPVQRSRDLVDSLQAVVSDVREPGAMNVHLSEPEITDGHASVTVTVGFRDPGRRSGFYETVRVILERRDGAWRVIGEEQLGIS